MDECNWKKAVVIVRTHLRSLLLALEGIILPMKFKPVSLSLMFIHMTTELY